ncbi:MAG: phosphoesterase [Verrucomicrobia bacterium]|nr:phosphoesterase [Verrucomicrobiota bacterium]
MTTPTAELVLCSRTADLPPAWVPTAGWIQLSEAALLEVLATLPLYWQPRDRAEQDPSFKQWIPYLLLRDSQGRLAAYPRQGSEARLHGLWSLGIGGHINPLDGETMSGQDLRVAWQTALWSGLRRELAEEFPDAAAGPTQFLGLIHEDRTHVGQVHLGAVFLHQPEATGARPGRELAGLQWLTCHRIGTEPWPLDRFELWSRLALQLLPPLPLP